MPLIRSTAFRRNAGMHRTAKAGKSLSMLTAMQCPHSHSQFEILFLARASRGCHNKFVIQRGEPSVKPTIQYFFVATALIAISLAIFMQPMPAPSAPTIAVAGQEFSQPAPLSLGELVSGFLGSWPMQLAAFYLGIATVMHLIATLLNLTGFPRWLFGIGIPLVGALVCYCTSVDQAYFTVAEVSIFALIGFSISFCFISFFFDTMFASKTETERSSD